MLNFITKSHTRKAATKEVVVRLNLSGAFANGEKRYNVVFRFYEDSYKKICRDTEYMVYAIDAMNSRIYFKESNAIDGYKITYTNAHSATTSKRVCVSVNNVDFWNSCVGDYNLLFDRNEGLYYIDFSKKAKK